MNKLTIYLDFDGTIVEHEHPLIGRYNPGSLEFVKKLQNNGHTIIINTSRVEFNDGTFEKAMRYLNLNEFEDRKIFVTQWTECKLAPKPWKLESGMTEIFIDDLAPNIPLKITSRGNNSMVDFAAVEAQLRQYIILI